ncbi:MAG: hypothetical protein HC879_09680 [Leptolyngbyaceae cyanobacterium SL_5_9]|nr:hypothetical protein [Leptolyngbyaceae cyanobacterium SL_5_9]NJO72453.1 hypothetical protein [Leptolyngbyaceae cyanobacterium RM1_406_9]
MNPTPNPQSPIPTSYFRFNRRHFLWLSTSACLATLTSNCTQQNSSSETVSFDPSAASWDEIVAAAEGSTVNWAMWGGSDKTNAYADQWVGDRSKASTASRSIGFPLTTR